MKKLLVILALVSVPSFASDDIEDLCKVKGGGVMAGYQCVEQKMELADKELNESYQEAIARISEEEAALRETWSETELVEPFRKAQRAWLKYRDAECEFSGLSSTPSPWQGVQIEECRLRMTLERVEYFKSVYVG
ncbi:lysozyme inhibitor LprI family protein [Vibrio antiquarius]|uniref:lysozyme inhibitor LprI family protein n=1 Tax=Vibrio antiquarius (strain Ex25) TaxID=150340 RepID=UPI00265D3940|nr:lysozyme inhibitor LprI family protein [Vibrio antiquarius]MCS0045437.1 lysozyme inhibitor LprI family protein [Vibrio antiquarius]